jgi:PhzF family phenazine biosynthesis protein
MRQWTIDAFSSRAFGGNPACVLEPLPAWPTDTWMQQLARENNAGATAFLVPADGAGRFDLRWFTASTEVPLCGHATLAAAHALFSEMAVGTDTITFGTASGELVVRRAGKRLQMNFPAQPAQRIEPPAGLAEALNVAPIEVWSGPYLVAVLDSPKSVERARPDLPLLRSISQAYGGQGNVGVVAVMADRSRYDVIDRFFAPGYGIEEDAATGSFHCILAPLMAHKLSLDRLKFHQASPGRGADLECVVEGDRVLLSGEAVTVAESALRVAPDLGADLKAPCPWL